MRVRIVLFISIVQSILFLAHAAVYATLVAFWHAAVLSSTGFQLAFAFLSISFIAASLLGYRYSNSFVRVFYTLAAGWLVMLNSFLLAACACWVAYGADRLAGLPIEPAWIALVLFSAALALGIYSILNAVIIRITRVAVRLPDLPHQWRGRVAAVVSDTHLGHVRGSGFARRIAALVNSLKPDIIFIVGDLFDGSAADPNGLAAPLKQLSAPFGAYFVTGNHEEFGDPTGYIRAVRGCGIEVLDNEKRSVDGLQIIGVNYRSSTHAGHFESVLAQIEIDAKRASILLLHAPNNLPVSEAAGISLQFSGHTHRGQIFPFTWITKRVYGSFVYGLNRLGRLTVFTSSGAGTWGPPARLGTNPEVVLVQFDCLVGENAMRLKIVQVGDPVLRQAAREMTAKEIASKEIQRLIADMRETMYDAPGVGLAAPQVGLPIQLAVIEDREENLKEVAPEILAERERQPVPFHVIVNPKLTATSEMHAEFFEGCLSIAGLTAIVPRAPSVHVECLDEKGERKVIEASGWYARILQHEIDHLAGRLYVDRMRVRTLTELDNFNRFWKGKSIREIRAALEEREP